MSRSFVVFIVHALKAAPWKCCLTLNWSGAQKRLGAAELDDISGAAEIQILVTVCGSILSFHQLQTFKSSAIWENNLPAAKISDICRRLRLLFIPVIEFGLDEEWTHNSRSLLKFPQRRRRR